MFSLIITIISIALVAALALATIYYGGSAFREGGDAAVAAQLVNEGQQLSGAAAISEANSLAFTKISDLVTQKALQSAPANWVDTIDASRAFLSNATVTDKVCAKVNEKGGYAAAGAGAPLNALTDVTKTYGCFKGGAANQNTMAFKY